MDYLAFSGVDVNLLSPTCAELLRLMGDLSVWRHREAHFLQTSVHDLSESELITAYSGLWNIDAELTETQQAYRNDVRDRLEIIVAFSEFPRDISAIEQSSWSLVNMIRLAPSLLSERCVDPEYSGPVLDVFGTVVIDWIACLQGRIL